MDIERFTVRIEEHEYHLNVTEQVQAIVNNLGLQNGHILISQKHTTCTLLLQEDEPCLIEDILKRLGWMVPTSEKKVGEHPDPHTYYKHDDFGIRTKNLDPGRKERINGHAHMRASLLGGPSIPLVVCDGKLDLGRWQQVLFFDFDDLDQRQERTITVST